MSAPKPPDPKLTADEAIKINTGTAQKQFELGSTNQVTPWGSLTYSADPNSPSGYTATQSMSPQMQAIYDQLMGGFSGAVGQATQPIDLSGLSPLPTSGDYGQNRTDVENALFSRLNPQVAQARTSLEQDLFNRGVRPGTEAYDRAMSNLANQENDLRLQTVLAGGQEQSRMFADALAGRQQGYNELIGSRSQPINELVALMSGSGVQSPGYVSTPQPGVQGVDYAGLVQQGYQNQLDAYQNKMSGLFNLGSAILGAIPFSDRRLKRNIVRVGTHPLGIGIYDYDLFGRPERGVMADEVAAVRPGAVFRDADGWLHVNYRML